VPKRSRRWCSPKKPCGDTTDIRQSSNNVTLLASGRPVRGLVPTSNCTRSPACFLKAQDLAGRYCILAVVFDRRSIAP
jgi:hypothetical protein